MTLFNKKKGKSARQILPPGIGRHLVAYGRDEYGLDRDLAPLNSPAAAATMVLSKMMTVDNKSQALAELRDAALAEGGWAIYGGSYATLAFLPEVDASPTAEDLHSARIDFLRAMGLGTVRGHLKPDDIVRWNQRYPGEL